MKFQQGCFVFYRASGLRAEDPATIQAEAVTIGVDPSIVPSYAGDRQAVSRAISQVNSGLNRQGWELTSIKTSRHDVVYGISTIVRDQERERVDFAFDDCLRWTDEHGNGEHVTGTHEIAQRVDNTYQGLRGKIVQADWTGAITEYLLGACQSTAMREDGRIYWVPPQHISKVQDLGRLLATIGINLVCCEIEAEVRETVVHAAAESLADKLEELEAEVKQFDGQQKPTTYRRRLEEYRKLRARAITYREALGIGVEHAERSLTQLEAAVSGMLDLRQHMTVKRGQAGTPTDPSTPSEPTGQATVDAPEKPLVKRPDQEDDTPTPIVEGTRYTPPASMQAAQPQPVTMSFDF